MVDEIYDRGYQAARTELNGSLTRGFEQLARAVGNAFATLNRIEYSAPWVRDDKRPRCN